MDSRESSASHGFLDALKNLGGGLLDTVQDRVALVSTELHEEKVRLIQILLWINAVIFVAMLATTFASITLVYLFWETARVAVLCSLTAFYVTAFAVIVISFRRYIARQPRPFAATLQELQEDRACIPPET